MEPATKTVCLIDTGMPEREQLTMLCLIPSRLRYTDAPSHSTGSTR